MRSLAWTGRAAGGADWVWLALLVAAGLFYIYRYYKREKKPSRRWAVIGLRLGSLALLVFFFFQPAVEWKAKRERPPLAVIVDASQSMSVADAASGVGAPVSRWAAALAWISNHKKELDDHFTPAYFTLDKAVNPLALEDLSKQKPAGPVSDLNLMLHPKTGGGDLKMALVFTDGRWGGGAKALEPETPAPLSPFIVGTGSAGAARDLRIDDLSAPSIAFKKTNLTVTVKIAREGLALRQVPVKIKFKGRVVASQTVDVSGGTAEASLVFAPQETGLATYQAEVPEIEGELNVKNNVRVFTCDVTRDRIRILYMSGQPGPQHAYLRQQLKQNPQVDLVSFVILRDPEDRVPFTDQEMSLIPFPTQDALLAQLATFDLVIFEQFYYPIFGLSPQIISALKNAVQKGAGFLMVANSALLMPGSPYWQPPWDGLLPLWTEDKTAATPARARWVLKEPGHPILRVAETEENSRRAWQEAGALPYEALLFLKPRADATVLAEWQSDQGAFPFLAVAPLGKGRVMMLTSLATWRWALRDPALSSSTDIYQRFWNNAVRWLTKSEDFRPVRLECLADAAGDGGVMLRVIVKDVHDRPEPAADVKIVVRGPEGQSWNLTPASLENGEYIDRFRPASAGAYIAKADAFVAGKKWGSDEKTFRPAAAWDENQDLRTNFGDMQRYAQATGGAFVSLDKLSVPWLLEKTEPLSWETTGRRVSWNTPWLLGLLLALLFAEWILRRLWGLP